MSLDIFRSGVKSVCTHCYDTLNIIETKFDNNPWTFWSVIKKTDSK